MLERQSFGIKPYDHNSNSGFLRRALWDCALFYLAGTLVPGVVSNYTNKTR